MAKIGFLGGTFNPIHNGHLKLAESAYRQLSLDKVLVMPSGVSYLKTGENVLSKYVRADMVKLAIKNYPYFEFSDIEINKEGNTYTYETLEELKKIYPLDDIYFLIGADTLYSIENWKYPDKVISNCILTVMVRNDNDITDIQKRCMYLSNKYNAVTEILDVEKIDISSTDIRKLINSGTYDINSEMLPHEVFEYIINNSLYK